MRLTRLPGILRAIACRSSAAVCSFCLQWAAWSQSRRPRQRRRQHLTGNWGAHAAQGSAQHAISTRTRRRRGKLAEAAHVWRKAADVPASQYVFQFFRFGELESLTFSRIHFQRVGGQRDLKRSATQCTAPRPRRRRTCSEPTASTTSATALRKQIHAGRGRAERRLSGTATYSLCLAKSRSNTWVTPMSFASIALVAACLVTQTRKHHRPDGAGALCPSTVLDGNNPIAHQYVEAAAHVPML